MGCQFKGFALPQGIQRSDVAGRDVTNHLKLLLRKNGSNLHTSAEMEIVKKIKEEKCFVAFNIEKSENEARDETDPPSLTHFQMVKSLKSVLKSLKLQRYYSTHLLLV